MLFRRAYAILFHSIIGFVFASTILIVPTQYNYMSLGGLLSGGVAIVGIIFGLWMCSLESYYD